MCQPVALCGRAAAIFRLEYKNPEPGFATFVTWCIGSEIGREKSMHWGQGAPQLSFARVDPVHSNFKDPNPTEASTTMAKLWLNSASRATFAFLSMVVLAPQAMAQPFFGAGEYQNQYAYNGGNGRGDVRLAAANSDSLRFNRPVNITITGALRSERGDWTIVDPLTGLKYELQQLGSFQNERWFREGNQIEVTGTALRGIPRTRANAIPLLVKHVARVGRPNQRITVSGLLKRSSFGGSWTVTDNRSGDKHLLLDAERFIREGWFRQNQQVLVEGITRSPRPNARMEALLLSVTNMRPLGIVPPFVNQRTTTSGVLRKTTTFGGWTVTDQLTKRKFTLMNIDSVKNRPWFKPGTPVVAEGVVRANMPSIYIEGTPLSVTTIRPLVR